MKNCRLCFKGVTKSMTAMIILTAFIVSTCKIEESALIKDIPGKRLLDSRLTFGLIEGLHDSVYFGTYPVFANRKTKESKINIFVMVLPSLDKKDLRSPIFHFEGGPGDGASTMATYYETLPQYRQNRDIVLIDFRGTGKSSPLLCEALLFHHDNPQEALDDMFPIEKVRACYTELSEKVDLKDYSTQNAIDDVEEIRQWLGYDKINLLGFSYGTRACQSYMFQYPDVVRSTIMYGAAPSFSHRPEPYAQDAQQVWEAICEDCEKDPLCFQSFPSLREDFNKVLRSGELTPVEYNYRNPETGIEDKLVIKRGMLAEIIRTLMYSTEGQRKLPWIINQAAKGDFSYLVERAIQRSISNNSISDAFYLSVTCSEDVPFIDTAMIKDRSYGTFLGDYRVTQEISACKSWVKYQVPEGYFLPLNTNTPTLIISGDHDPVTPPKWGVAMSKRMTNCKHIIVPMLSHVETGMSNIDCLMNSFLTFFDTPSKNLEMPCVQEMKPIPFKVN